MSIGSKVTGSSKLRVVVDHPWIHAYFCDGGVRSS